MLAVFTEQVFLESSLIDTGSQVPGDDTQIDFGIFQAGRSTRRRCHIKNRSNPGIDLGLAHQQLLTILIDQLGADAANFVCKAEIAQLQRWHDLACIFQEQPFAYQRNFKQEVFQHVIAYITRPHQVEQYPRHPFVKTKHLQEIRQRSDVVTFQDRQYQCGRAEACFARNQNVGVAVNRRKRQRIVLNRINLALEHSRCEVIAACNRQTGIVQTVAQVVCQLQTVTARADDHGTGLEAGVPCFNQKALFINADMGDILIEMLVDLFVADQSGLVDK